MNALLLAAAASAAASAVLAQDPLSLPDALAAALQANPTLTASEAARDAAKSGILEAKSGALPKVNYAESWTRSDNPVFAFSALLTQRQFTQENFALPALNRPGFVNNFQSLVSADQPLYDGGQTRRAVRVASWNHESAGETVRSARMQVIAQAARAYYAVLLAAEQLKVTDQALRSAAADLTRAESRRAAGVATDADVLSVRVHAARVREEQIQRTADLEVARATLNEAMGMPLPAPHELTTPLKRLPLSRQDLNSLEQAAAAGRPEIRQSRLNEETAKARNEEARRIHLPEVMARGAFEVDRQQFINQGGANWLVSIGLRWNLFNGFAGKARVEATAAAQRQAAAERTRTESGVRLQVRQAWARLQAAEQRIETARAASEEAAESLRITQNRYEAGLATIAEVLRTETALLETRTRQVAAIHDQRVAAVLLEFAAGTLSPSSEVLQ